MVGEITNLYGVVGMKEQGAGGVGIWRSFGPWRPLGGKDEC